MLLQLEKKTKKDNKIYTSKSSYFNLFQINQFQIKTISDRNANLSLVPSLLRSVVLPYTTAVASELFVNKNRTTQTKIYRQTPA